MAGFEVIVRPVVFPNIRPVPSRSLPLEDKPEQGQAVLSGSNGQVIALTHTFSGSSSTQGGHEKQRTYDVARIRPEGSGHGSSSRSGESGSGDTYIDVEVVKRIEMNDGSVWSYSPLQEAENIEIINRDLIR